jgi:hypothetical protein
MCPSQTYTPSSVLGRSRFIGAPSVQASIQELRALIEVLQSNASCITDVIGSSAESCHLPLNLSQSRFLAALVTTTAPRSTWWSTAQADDWWLMYGVLGEDFGPRVTVCITATSDRDVFPC